jgi:ribonuclease-3
VGGKAAGAASRGFAANHPLTALQGRLGFTFTDAGLLQRAVTHKSFGSDQNERLEFLGDSVLNLAVSDLLFKLFDHQDEGELTRVRAHLVRQDTLHKLALTLDLPRVMRLSEGEAKGGGAQRPSILADALEAIIGAIYLDGGFDQAKALVFRLFEPLVGQTTSEVWRKDPKTALQEWLQGRKLALPKYRIEATRGKAHEQHFTVVCEVTAKGWSVTGEGPSRRAAEQVAAQQALDRLQADLG